MPSTYTAENIITAVGQLLPQRNIQARALPADEDQPGQVRFDLGARMGERYCSLLVFDNASPTHVAEVIAQIYATILGADPV